MTLPLVVDSTMPGSLGIPFRFAVMAGSYRMTRDDNAGTWFCAPLDRATASFPGLGVVVANGDCIGIRRRASDGRLDWVVDNSNYNGMKTAWSRAVKESEAGLISFAKGRSVSDASVEKAVTFDGFYSGLLNFTFVDGARRREMKFDYDGKSEKMIGMLGKRMLVLHADSVELRYKWISPTKP